MKYLLLLSACALFFLIACNDSGTQQTTDTSDTTHIADTSQTASAACYAYIVNKDSIIYSLSKLGNHVSGSAIYSLFAKDRNTGTLDGSFNGDTLRGMYTFQSEGKTSVREFVMLKHGTDLLQGFGDIITNGDTVVFKNVSEIKFDTTFALKKTACESINP